jgi:hypothetical protein
MGAMLHELTDGVHKNYYDPKFHCVDFDAKARAADEQMRSANSIGAAFLREGRDDGCARRFAYLLRATSPDFAPRIRLHTADDQ